MNRGTLRWVAGLGLASAILMALAFREQFDAAALDAWVTAAGPAGPVLFIALYTVATVLFMPGSVLTLAGGALFGPFWGTLWNLAGATAGAALAFLVARYLGGEWIERRMGGRLARLSQGVASEGWRFVAFVRLVPLFPFNLLNYALGLTRIRFLPYVVASWLFMLPATGAYTYLGYAGREALAGGEGRIRTALIALALLAAVAFLPRLVSRLRQGPMLAVDDLRQALDEKTDLLLLDVRTAADFDGDQGHLPAALNLPVEELPERLAELGPRLDRRVAIVCRTDRRSARAARILAGAGFTDVHVVRGGMTAWLEHGWPVASPPPPVK